MNVISKERYVKIIKGILAILTFMVSGHVFACGDGEYPVMSTHKEDGTKIGLFISQAQMEQTQTWSPENSEPPLNVSAAYQMAMNWGRQQYTRYDGVKVREISIKKYGCSLVSNRWYYVVDITPVIDGNEVWSGGTWAAVLMDGTVIGPRKY